MIEEKKKSFRVDDVLFISYDEESYARKMYWRMEVCPHIISCRKQIVDVLGINFNDFDGTIGFDWLFHNYEISCRLCLMANKVNETFWLTEVIAYLKGIHDFEKFSK